MLWLLLAERAHRRSLCDAHSPHSTAGERAREQAVLGLPGLLFHILLMDVKSFLLYLSKVQSVDVGFTYICFQAKTVMELYRILQH